MGTKHTQGEWKVYELFKAPLKSEDGLSEHLSHWILNEQNVFIADIGYNTVKNSGFPLVDKLDEMKANAKLIALSPLMYEFINRMISENNFIDEQDKQEAIELLKQLE